MKIVILRHSIRNRGGDRLVLDYCSYLAAQGHKIEYWTNEVSTPFRIDQAISIKRVPIPGILGTMIFTLFKKFSGDIVLVDLIIMACLASLRNKKRILYLAQDYDVKYYKLGLLKALTRSCYSFGLNKLQIITVCVSEGLADILKQYKPKQIKTVSNGVNLSIFYRDEKGRYQNQKERPFVILLFARSDYRKGLDIGIRAVKELYKIRPGDDWEFWTIGTAKVEIPTIPAIRIKPFGFLKTDEELKDIFSAADVYLVPSRSEGLSLLLLQALASQCAVVATEASHILHHETNALVSANEDWKALAENVNRVLNDFSLRSKLKENARRLAEQYSLEKSCEKFEEVITSFGI
ncbi:MAG: glycosyltransferase family 4 protein [Candidatus Omnitrophota bacterium]